MLGSWQVLESIHKGRALTNALLTSKLSVVKNEGPDFYVDVEQVPTPQPGKFYNVPTG